MKVILTEKSGFIAKNFVDVKAIKKGRLVPFYSFERDGFFVYNLPKGEYIIKSDFIKKTSPKIYEVKKYKAEKNEFKGVFPKIVIKKYSGKAGIDIKNNIIVISPYIFSLPYQSIMFILLHEIGHYYFFTEYKCDNFAKNKMLQMGFNPSQISKGINEALSKKSVERKIRILNNFNCTYDESK